MCARVSCPSGVLPEVGVATLSSLLGGHALMAYVVAAVVGVEQKCFLDEFHISRRGNVNQLVEVCEGLASLSLSDRALWPGLALVVRQREQPQGTLRKY
eukprot:15467116-Alexandrium_andersonii.AAC.1